MLFVDKFVVDTLSILKNCASYFYIQIFKLNFSGQGASFRTWKIRFYHRLIENSARGHP